MYRKCQNYVIVSFRYLGGTLDCNRERYTNFGTQQTIFDQTKGTKAIIKGLLISKCLFGVFNFFQKTNENMLTRGIIVVKSNSFIRFLQETSA